MKGIFAYTFLDRNGNSIASQNGQMPLMPASNMKLITGYAAYRTLGKDFKFKTSFTEEGSKLLVSGDPTPLLDGPAIRKIMGEISGKKVNFNEIEFNNPSIDSVNYLPSWALEDRKYTYQSRITPFSVNEGSVPKGKGSPDISRLVNPHGSEHRPSRNPMKLLESAIMSAALSVSREEASNNAQDQAIHWESLADIISHMETVSCNFSAEILQKYMGHNFTGKKGSWRNGTKAILNFLNKLNLDTEGITIADGSGLSRMNLLKTDLLASLVHAIRENEDSEFLKLLPSPGAGTLQKRLSDLSNLSIHAKTGSIGYCASLTGYMEKSEISFSIIINNSTDPGQDLPVQIDAFLTEMVKKL